MAVKVWKIALGVGCGVVLLVIAALVLLPMGFWWLESAMQRRGAEPLTAMEVLDCELFREGDSVRTSGSVRNGGRGAVREVKVSLLWTDGSGSLIERDWVFAAGAGELAPGASGDFDHLREEPGEAIQGVACQVECVSTGQAMVCR